VLTNCIASVSSHSVISAYLTVAQTASIFDVYFFESDDVFSFKKKKRELLLVSVYVNICAHCVSHLMQQKRKCLIVFIT